MMTAGAAFKANMRTASGRGRRKLEEAVRLQVGQELTAAIFLKNVEVQSTVQTAVAVRQLNRNVVYNITQNCTLF